MDDQKDKKILELEKSIEERRKFLEKNLENNYFKICTKKCTNLKRGNFLKKEEKICLGKCIDRAHEYLEKYEPYHYVMREI